MGGYISFMGISSGCLKGFLKIREGFQINKDIGIIIMHFVSELLYVNIL